MSKKEIKFEDQMNRLKEIVSTMERGDLPLDELLLLFEEGIATYRKCNQILETTEAKIETITSDLTEV